MAVTATVKSIDAKIRKVTLQFADGTSRTVKVGKAIDLAKVSPGDNVTAQLTDGVAVVVEKS